MRKLLPFLSFFLFVFYSFDVTEALPPCVLNYPNTSSNDRPGVVFSESYIFQKLDLEGRNLVAYYSDEHPITLGVREVIVISNSGTTTTNFNFSTFQGNTPYCMDFPLVGTTATIGDLAGTDTATCSSNKDCARPLAPALFITDITFLSTSTSGDWQNYGTPNFAQKICGVWKGAVRTVDNTKSPSVVSVAPDADGNTPNNWNLGNQSSQYNVTGLNNIGWGAIVSWNIESLGLLIGRSYRFQVMIHDGDQNNVGGDTGQFCENFVIPPPNVGTTSNGVTGGTSGGGSGGNNKNKGLAIGLTLAAFALVGAALGTLLFVKRKKLRSLKFRIVPGPNPSNAVINNPLVKPKPVLDNPMYGIWKNL